MRQRVSTEPSELETLLDTVFNCFGYDLRDYSLPLMRRRVAAWQEHEGADGIAIGDVDARRRETAAGSGLCLGSGDLEPRGVDVAGEGGGAARAERVGDGTAEAVPGAGDHHGFAGKTDLHPSSS